MNQYIEYETAISLKEKRFDWATQNYYRNSAFLRNGTRDYNHNGDLDEGYQSAPLKSELCRWLREEKLISVTAMPYREEEFEDNKIMWYYSVVNLNEEGDILCNEVDLGTVESDFFDIYEEAIENGLIHALKLI